MRASLRNLFEHYRAHHDMDRPLLQWIGVVGCIAFPLFYFMRRAVDNAPGFDDLPLRLVAAALCLGLALRRWWPEQVRGWYIGYSYLVVFYSLSFLLSYAMLRNHGGTPGVVNMVVGAVLVILLADWRNALAMLLGGYVLAVVAHHLTDPQPELFREFIFAAGGSLLLVVGGALSHQGQKRVELNRMRRVYTSLAGSIAHEMRNPLAQVRHSLDRIAAALEAGPGPQEVRLPPERRQAALQTIQEGRDAIARGLQAIELTLQQLQPAALDFSGRPPLSALACVRRAVETFAYEDATQRSRVYVREEGDFRFRGDGTALELVLFNLLKNALYYVPLRPAMTVTITVTAAPPRIIVHDTGPGIDPVLHARLFQEFQTSGKAEGTGLGLAFCRRVMRAVGGDIRCRSERGHFTEFTLAFPPEPAMAPAEAPAAEPARPLAGRTVLVVDDQALNRAIAKALAGELGLRVLQAEHGQQALDLLRDGTVPDAILMDVNMPGLDGIATTRLLRALPDPAGRVPVLAVTANDSPAVQAAARAAGLQGVLGKPIDPRALERELGAVLRGQAAEPALPPPPASELLNIARLDDMRRLGLVEELLPGGLVEIRRQLRTLEQALGLGGRDAIQEPLHALVGLAGEIGAQALHALARQRYAALLAGTEADLSWVREFEHLLTATEQALWLRYGVQSAEPSAPAPLA